MILGARSNVHRKFKHIGNLLGGLILASMPPKKRSTSEQCGVCCQAIVKGKDESLFCGGECQQWHHRYCAGVPAKVYKNLSEKGVTFYCFACSLDSHRKEIASLKGTVEALKSEIAELKSSSPSPSSARKSSPQVPTLPPPRCPSSEEAAEPRPAVLPQPERSPTLMERKYNVILFGLDECPRGTSRSARLDEDLKKAIFVLSKADQSIDSNTIKDIYRLGRYTAENKKPRPLLVKFIRVADVARVLSKRGSLPVIIKPDMSPHERKIESLLLKERWSLMQSGVPRESIKIRGHRLLIRNKLHGQVTMSGSDISFCRHTSCSFAENSSDHNAQPIVSAPPLSTASQSQSHPHTSVVTLPATLNDIGCPANSQDHSSAPTSHPDSDAPQSVSDQ